MFFSLKNILKISLVCIVFLSFFWFISHLLEIENTDSLKNSTSVPIIEADHSPYRLKFYEQNDEMEVYDNSCTLNNEC